MLGRIIKTTFQRPAFKSQKRKPQTIVKNACNLAIGTLTTLGTIYSSIYYPFNNFSRELSNRVINSKQTCGELIGFRNSVEQNLEGNLYACFDSRHYKFNYWLANNLYKTLETSLPTGRACANLHFSGLQTIFLNQQLTVQANRILSPEELKALTYVLLSPYAVQTELIQKEEYFIYRTFSAKSLPDIPSNEIGILNALYYSRDKAPNMIADLQDRNFLINPHQTYNNTPAVMPWYLKFQRFVSSEDPTNWRVFQESINSKTGRSRWSTVLVKLPRSLEEQRDRYIDSVRRMEQSGAVEIKRGEYQSRNDYFARFKDNPKVPHISTCSGSTNNP